MTTDVHARRRRRRRRWTLLVALVLLLLVFPLRRALRLAAEPSAPKDCPPLEPAPAGLPVREPLPQPPASWLQKGGTINDASCLNRTAVHGIIDVRSEDDVRQALAYARTHGLKVATAGVRHSMGGHAFAVGALVLDMRNFKRIRLHEEVPSVTVQSGATWHDIQLAIHPRFAVKAMQSTDIFTVGGSISVNAHGMDHRAGSVGRTVRAMRVMFADGTVKRVSRDEDPRLFGLIVGGYGLFGIILEAELDVTQNVVYASERRTLDYREFPQVLVRDISPDDRYGLLYGHLSTAPGNLLEEMFLYTYSRVDGAATIPPLGEVSQVKLRRLVFNLGKQGPFWMRLKWFAEKHIEPRMESCTVSRNEALGQGEACLVSRNDPMHDSVAYLRNDLPEETDILHEYFIPRQAFVRFVDDLRHIVRAEDANLLNASVRVVHREDTALTYAPEDDMLAVVLYLNQTTDREGRERMERLTQRLIDACSDAGGRFFLPYQLAYTKEQLARAYPEAAAFFAAKREIDPGELFTSTFYEKYGRI